MNKDKTISGFSKLSKRGKIKWLVENFFKDPESVMKELSSYWHKDEEKQKVLDGFSENTISNFPLPFGVAPNFVINGKTYAVPMVIEESSVVAAASAAAKFWMKRGGFSAKVISMKKIGQLHFKCSLDYNELKAVWPSLKNKLVQGVSALTKSMEQRGGGILSLELKDFSDQIENYYQIFAEFDTCDSMGANFINSILEEFGEILEHFFRSEYKNDGSAPEVEIIMAILSNYTPECIVNAEVSCTIDDLKCSSIQEPQLFAEKFKLAVEIAREDPYRASTHNKGIFNGIDAVVIATGNDFRAVESCGHTYASRDGQYRSLSNCKIENDIFKFNLEMPLSLGTVGGLTALHPIAKRSLEMLSNPTADELMKIVASVGLAQNFAALRSLVTTGIQKGHMKMHLMNILIHLDASEKEIESAIKYFKDKVVSFSAVREHIFQFRKNELNT